MGFISESELYKNSPWIGRFSVGSYIAIGLVVLAVMLWGIFL